MKSKYTEKLSIILYGPNKPKFLQLNKSLLNLTVAIVPLIILFILLAALGYSYFNKMKLADFQKMENTSFVLLKEEIRQLEKKNLILNQRNASLEKRVSFGGSTTHNELLALMTSPLSMKDLRSLKVLEIDSPYIKTENDSIQLYFNLKNSSTSEKSLTGYVTVVQIQENILEFFPRYTINEKALFLNYNKGESFNIANFRPFSAVFKNHNKLPVRYKVLILNREGDLLHYSELGPYETGK